MRDRKAKNDYLSKLNTKASAAASYEHFKKTGTCTLAAKPKYSPGLFASTTSSPSLFADFKSIRGTQLAGNHSVLEQPGFTKIASKAIEKLSHTLGHGAEFAFAAVEAVAGSQKRANQSLKEGHDKTASAICGTVGALAQVGTTVGGDVLVFASTEAIILETGGVGIIPALMLAKNGFKEVHAVGHKVGDAAQSGCLKVLSNSTPITNQNQFMDYDAISRAMDISATPRLRKF